MKYVNQLRLDKAVALLQQTDLSVHQICEQVGIRKSSILAALIKERIGYTPTEYRRTIRFIHMT
ncbi:HTH-type transcriptional activator RhaR [compost metagenome]